MSKPHIKLKARTGKISIVNSYDAASTGRRLGGWGTSSAGPNDALLNNLGTLRARSHDSVRNNAWITNGLRNVVADEIGTGIVPRSKAPDADFRLAANELWNDWSGEADADGNNDIYGLMALASRSRREAGEGILRLRPRQLSDNLAVPLQIQALEAAHLPIGYDPILSNGNRVRAGIEFNSIGRRAAYHMYRAHPGDSLSQNGVVNAAELVRVPAEAIIHHYAVLRPGQLRGQPETVQALIQSKMFSDYSDAELERKKNRSSYTGAITRPDLGEADYAFDPMTGEPLTTDAAGVAQMNLEPGSMVSLLPGEDIKLFEGDPTGQGYADFVRQQLLGVAAGLGIPYEVISGDWSHLNDRLARVMLQQYRRVLEQSQWLIVIPQVCNPIWTAFIDMAVLSGRLNAPDYAQRRREYLRVEWRTDGFDYIHPVQDIDSKLKAIRGGIEARAAVVAERGWDVEEIDRQQAEDNARAQGLGLSYETNTNLMDEEENAQE